MLNGLAAASQIFTVIFTVNPSGISIAAGLRAIRPEATFRDRSTSIDPRDHRGHHRRASDFTPTCSSWLDQVELWLAKIERDVIARGVFTSVPDLKRMLMRYIRHYNKNAKPVK